MQQLSLKQKYAHKETSLLVVVVKLVLAIKHCV